MIEEAIECYKSAIQATSSTSTLDFTNHVTFDSEQYNAKTVLLNNLAASFAIQTDYEKARKQLQHITELIPSDLISQKEHLKLLPGHFSYKGGASLRWSSPLYCLMWNSIGKMRPTLLYLGPEIIFKYKKTILLAVYILLKEGKKDLALQILRTRNLSLFKYSQK